MELTAAASIEDKAASTPSSIGSKEFFKWMIAHVTLHWAPGYTLMEKNTGKPMRALLRPDASIPSVLITM